MSNCKNKITKYVHKENGKEYTLSYTMFKGHIIFSCENEKDIVIRNCFGASDEVNKYFIRVVEPNKPGRPPLNKPAVSVKIYEGAMGRFNDIKLQTGKPVIQIIDELSKRAGKCKVTWTVGIFDGLGRQGWCECGHSVFDNNIYCSHCGKVITHYVQPPNEAVRG